MQLWLSYGVYIAIGAVFVVLAFGVVNLVRTDAKSASRSGLPLNLLHSRHANPVRCTRVGNEAFAVDVHPPLGRIG